jgi:hypothetical protein
MEQGNDLCGEDGAWFPTHSAKSFGMGGASGYVQLFRPHFANASELFAGL